MSERYRIQDEVDMGSPRGMFSGGSSHRWARTFVPRSSQEPGGFGYLLRTGAGKPPLELPKDAAGYNVMQDGSWEWVTWKQIHRRRAEQQRERLARIRQPQEQFPKPAQLWVFYNDSWLYGGWHVYVRYWSALTRNAEYARGGRHKGGWSDARIASLKEKIPLDLPSDREGWLLPPEPWRVAEEWCEAFVAAYPKRKTKEDPRKAGLLNGWTDGCDFFLTRDTATGEVEA